MQQTMETMFRAIVREEVREALNQFTPTVQVEDAGAKKALSLTEAAKLIGVSYPTMLDLANRKDFPAFQVGKKWIVPRDKLNEWLREQTRGVDA